MLHELVLAPGILQPLTQAVHVQLRLLKYAAGTTVLDGQACAAFIDADPQLAGRGGAAADWVWAGETREQQLARFAAHARTAEKAAWVRVRRKEAAALFCGAPAELTPLWRKAPAWQKAGGKFLEKFYEALSSDSGLPGKILGQAENFNRHHFLHEFSQANAGVYVCAFCDEARIGTRHKGRLHADIDHFFPKSIYPHLSIHPYNMVPTCHSCNSGAKGQTDPLAKGRTSRISPRTLGLPYRSKGLAERTAVQVDLARTGQPEGSFRLVPRIKGQSESEIAGLARNVKIPARWSDPATANEIGETAFRRLRQFMQAQPELMEAAREDALLRKLDQFLGVMRQENVGRDPLSLPVKWLLANIARRARDDQAAAKPIIAEIRAQIATRPTCEKWERTGAELRQILSDLEPRANRGA